MTKEDAIKTLKELWRETNDPWYEDVYYMAINALEADRKTESNSEVPHSCMTCKHKDKADNDFPCVRCFYDDTMYEPQTDYSNYERAIEQIQYDMLYESTYNAEDGSM